MKKRLLLLLAFALTALIAVTFNACTSDDDEINFDEQLLVGKWLQNSSQVYYVYNSDYTGKTWDESEVIEEQAQAFTWTLVADDLTQIHIMEIGGNVPKEYQVLTLSYGSMTYKDVKSGTVYSFTKQ